MQLKLRQLLLPLFVVAFTFFTSIAFSQATVTTDKPDYAPRSNAVFTGSGFQPGETVALRVKNLFRACNTVTADSSYLPWTVTADERGGFTTNWTVCDCAGDSLRLRAVGQASHDTAYALFSDAPTVTSVTPNSGLTTETKSVTIKGDGFVSNGTITVTFGGIPATNISRVDNKTLNCKVPANTAGPVEVAVSVSGSGGGNNGIGRLPNGYVYNKSSQTIAFNAIGDKTYGDDAFAIAPTASSGLPVSITTTGGISYSSSTGLVTITGAGPASITASQGGNGDYNTATPITREFNVDKATATLSLDNLTHVYDGSVKSATAATVPAGLSGVSISGNGQTNAGTYPVEATLDNPNYRATPASGNLFIDKAPVTLSFGNLVFDYDGTEKVATATASPNVSGINVSGSGTDAGDYAATASLVNTNYKAAPISGTLKINRVNATINVSGYSGAYDGKNHSATGTAKDLDGNNLSGLTLGNSFKDYPGGTANWSFAGTTNYLPASGSVDIAISKATPSITLIVGGPYTFNGDPQGVQSATVSGVLVNGVAENLGNASVTYDGSNNPPTNAGKYNVISSFAGNNNYTAAENATGSLVIAKATATIDLSNLSHTYDGNEKTVTLATTPSGLSVVTTYAGSTTAPKNAGSYAVSSTISDINYQGTATGSLIIAKAPTTTTLSVNNITYNGDVNPGLASVSGAGDLNESLTINYVGTGSTSYGPSATAPTNAGSYSATATYLESNNYLASTETKSFTIAKANAVISIVPYSDVYDGVAHTATGTATGVKGENLNSSISFASSYTNVPGGNTVWNFSGGTNYNDDNGNTNVTISKANQSVTWTAPAAITYGDLLTSSQLNATASGISGGSAAGSLTYEPALGTLLNAGTHTLKVTAAATNNYNEATEEVSITVDKATQQISWSNPSNIIYPAVINATQLNATVSGVDGGTQPGALSYTPALGAILNAGEHTLSVTAAATDNYYSAIKTVTLIVDKGSPVITWTNPANIVYGTALTSTQLNASANMAGTLAYTPAANTYLHAGNAKNLSVEFTPDDIANYNTVSKTITINVSKANPIITVNGYSGTYDGNAHGAILVSAIGGQNEDLSGSVTLGTGFTNAPGGTANWNFAGDDDHNAASGSVAITINKATPSVTLTVGGPFTYDGNTHGVQSAVVTGITVNGTAQSLGNATVTYNNGSTLPKGAGSYSVLASYAGNTNYEAVSESGSLTINKANASVTPNAASKYCGQADPTFTGTLAGFISTDNVIASYSVNGSTIGATLSPAGVLGNYDIDYKTANFTINGVTIDASASSTPVAFGTSATLSAKISPAVAGVSVTFYQDNVVKATTVTNADGVATLSVTGLNVDVYQIKAVAGNGCNESVVYLPVYDPNAGFVTGGGWINSPAGAYVADASLTGKANFGFVSKYKKGSTQVDGSTEFQFHAGGLNFKSLLHESGTLVIAGSKAMYKGTGTVNGVSGYSFMVSAIDGGYNGGTAPDKFRIKIWNTNTTAVIYDNQKDALDNADPATVIGGGSIVIQQTTTKKSETVATQVAEQMPAAVGFTLSALPNPTTSNFNVKIESSNATEKITVRVVDMFGRTVQTFNNLQNGQSLQIGSNYRPGVYILEMMQGNSHKQLKLIKQNN